MAKIVVTLKDNYKKLVRSGLSMQQAQHVAGDAIHYGYKDSPDGEGTGYVTRWMRGQWLRWKREKARERKL